MPRSSFSVAFSTLISHSPAGTRSSLAVGCWSYNDRNAFPRTTVSPEALVVYTTQNIFLDPPFDGLAQL